MNILPSLGLKHLEPNGMPVCVPSSLQAFKPSLGLGLNSVYKIYLKGYWQE